MWEDEEKQKRIRQMVTSSTQTVSQVRAAMRSDPGSDFGSARSDPAPRDAEAQARADTREAEAQARADTRTRGTDAERVRVRDAVVETDGAPDDEDTQEALQELQARMNRMRERQERERERERETARLRELVARNLGQPSADIGAVPFIDSAAAAASSSYVRSRSPVKKEQKSDFSITVPILDPETNQPRKKKKKRNQ
jgi:hypothetical protein